MAKGQSGKVFVSLGDVILNRLHKRVVQGDRRSGSGAFAGMTGRRRCRGDVNRQQTTDNGQRTTDNEEVESYKLKVESWREGGEGSSK